MNIEELVNNYAEKKAEFAKIKRETEEINHKIKDKLISEVGNGAYLGEKYTVSTTEINNDKLNEQLLISMLRENCEEELCTKLIKTKEYIDMDELEDALYNRVLSADLVNGCVVHNAPTIRLNISENKRLTKDEE